ncbi:hypothetical protein [Sulfurimonas sp.]|uniref:hypothetical protein n=1 Tax=Sulfurimonas sp. TaxID=2022749 RepID=UPI003D0F7923
MRYFIFLILSALTLCLISCGESTNTTEQNSTQEENTTQEQNSTQTLATYETNQSLYNTRNITPIEVDFNRTTSLNNKGAYVTSQCYTKTVDANGTVHNPCFTCHINSNEPNYIDDWDLQETRSFGEYTATNRFTNLFKDRTSLVSQISDEEILSYVRENNYMQKGQILLANKLKYNLPDAWDYTGNGVWNGYVPDCYFNFDDEGFDKNSSGDYTGWRAFAYYPFLGTFWPTNGSTDDVLIRLADVFQEDENGTFNKEVYKLNLSIVEALIKKKDVSIDSVDENVYGVDLNQNGTLDTANTIVFKWVKPTYNSGTGKIENFSMSYVGAAKALLVTNEYLIAPGLYPKNTEFLHSVRYIDISDDNQSVTMAPRMKELRYAKKLYWLTYANLRNASLAEIKEKDDFPDRLRTIIGNSEYGASNNLGWVYQGFIEDEIGELRPQNYEETQYCIGCHSGIGAIADSTFVFQRKFDHNATMQGWYHWSQDANGLSGIAEPLTKDGRQEYQLYLEQNHAGDEFRSNDEVMEKFFDANGSVNTTESQKIATDISYLLLPSVQRALQLDKAYKVIVEEQSYIYGRDAHIAPVTNVYEEITIDEDTQIEALKY